MSKLNIEVIGTADYYPEGMFGEPEEVVDATVVVEANATGVQTVGKDGFNAIVSTLQSLAARDAVAPAFGSASSLQEREKYEAALRIAVVEGIALLRIYHQKASEFNLEVSAGEYLTPDGQPTDEPWSSRVLGEGDTLNVAVIESNAITIAIYA